jgi:hypothetical protein
MYKENIFFSLKKKIHPVGNVGYNTNLFFDRFHFFQQKNSQVGQCWIPRRLHFVCRAEPPSVFARHQPSAGQRDKFCRVFYFYD